jgi:hypothetical protein
VENVSQNVSAPENQTSASASVASSAGADNGSAEQQPAVRIKLIALKSGLVYAVTQYRIDSGTLNYALTNRQKGSVGVTEVDWLRTSQINSEPLAPVSTTTALNQHSY